MNYYRGKNIDLSTFTLGLNAAQNTDYIKNVFKQKLRIIKFPTKNSFDACICLSQEWRWDSKNLPFLK